VPGAAERSGAALIQYGLIRQYRRMRRTRHAETQPAPPNSVSECAGRRPTHGEGGAPERELSRWPTAFQEALRVQASPPQAV